MTLLGIIILLNICTVVLAAIAVASVIRGDDELAGLAAGHMAASALASVACWFVL
jgi:hypothetical protein